MIFTPNSAGNRISEPEKRETDKPIHTPKVKLKSRESERLDLKLEPVIDFSKTTKLFNGMPFDRDISKTPYQIRKEKSNVKIIKKTNIEELPNCELRQSSRKKLRIKSKKANYVSSQVNFYTDTKNYFYKPEMFLNTFQSNTEQGVQEKQVAKESNLDQDSTSLTNGIKSRQPQRIYLYKKGAKLLNQINEEGKEQIYLFNH